MGNELFKNIPSKVGDLVKDVRNGRIGLPDLQRPFVWKDNKVRELFDSMLKGYVSHYRQKLGEEGYRKTCKEHALPDNFENMDYMEFLSQRRILMAQTVRKAYQRLCE